MGRRDETRDWFDPPPARETADAEPIAESPSGANLTAAPQLPGEPPGDPAEPARHPAEPTLEPAEPTWEPMVGQSARPASDTARIGRARTITTGVAGRAGPRPDP